MNKANDTRDKMGKICKPPTLPMRIAGRVALVVAIMLLCLSEARAESYRSYLGFSVAKPTETDDSTRSSFWNSVSFDSVRTFIYEIDDQGRVGSAINALERDPLLLRYVDTVLTTAGLLPSLRDDKPVASKLPIIVRFRSGRRPPDLTFPVAADGRIEDEQLYSLALRLNGIEPPRLIRFASLHASFTKDDSLGTFPSMIVRLDIDTSGQPTRIDLVRSGLRGHTPLILSKCNWAEYAPAKVDGRPAAATCYLVVLALPLQHYPQPSFDSDSMKDYELRRQVQIRLVPDSCEWVARPLPIRFRGDSLRIEKSALRPQIYNSGVVKIDTLGKLQLLTINSPFAAVLDSAAKVVSHATFYPALTWQGQAAEFRSILRFGYGFSGILRIEPTWWAESATDLYSYPVE